MGLHPTHIQLLPKEERSKEFVKTDLEIAKPNRP